MGSSIWGSLTGCAEDIPDIDAMLSAVRDSDDGKAVIAVPGGKGAFGPRLLASGAERSTLRDLVVVDDHVPQAAFGEDLPEAQRAIFRGRQQLVGTVTPLKRLDARIMSRQTPHAVSREGGFNCIIQSRSGGSGG